MIGPPWTDVVSAICSAASLLITAAGLLAVYVQIKKLRDATWSDTHSKLTEQSLELIRFFAENTESYDYFYKAKKLESNAPSRVFILYAAEALANFMEHLALRKESLPDKQWLVWRRYICCAYADSCVLQDFIREHAEWYSSELMDIIATCKPSSYASENCAEVG